jgi:hypothetical protein
MATRSVMGILLFFMRDSCCVLREGKITYHARAARIT